MQELPIGLIGTGRIGRLHAQHLSHRIAQAKLMMVSDIEAMQQFLLKDLAA